jgi:hypothetical protein
VLRKKLAVDVLVSSMVDGVVTLSAALNVVQQAARKTSFRSRMWLDGDAGGDDPYRHD